MGKLIKNNKKNKILHNTITNSYLYSIANYTPLFCVRKSYNCN